MGIPLEWKISTRTLRNPEEKPAQPEPEDKPDERDIQWSDRLDLRRLLGTPIVGPQSPPSRASGLHHTVLPSVRPLSASRRALSEEEPNERDTQSPELLTLQRRFDSSDAVPQIPSFHGLELRDVVPSSRSLDASRHAPSQDEPNESNLDSSDLVSLQRRLDSGDVVPQIPSSHASGLHRDVLASIRDHHASLHTGYRDDDRLVEVKASLILVRRALSSLVPAHRPCTTNASSDFSLDRLAGDMVTLVRDVFGRIESLDASQSGGLQRVLVSRFMRRAISFHSDHDERDREQSQREQQRQQTTSPTSELDILSSTRSAVCMFYAEECEDEPPAVWEIGCWPGVHECNPADLFLVVLQALLEVPAHTAVSVEGLLLRGFSTRYPVVERGVDLLKALSTSLHQSDEIPDNCFLHPLTGDAVQIARFDD